MQDAFPADVARLFRERFVLTNQSAQDLTRYDFLKDVARVGRILETFQGATGYAVLLTNDRSYWRPSSRDSTVDNAFRLYDGRTVSGELGWLDHAGTGTTRRREQPIVINGTYVLGWRPFSRIGTGTYSEFRYLVIAVNDALQES